MTEVAPAAVVVDTAPSWFAGVDAEVSGYIQNRGLDKLDAKAAALKAIEFHRNAETKLGAPSDQLIRLPKDSGDVATRDAMFNKLGRPADPKAYDFKGVETDETFENWARPTFHKLGLSQDQAREVMAGLASEATRVEAEETAAQAAAFEVEKQALLKNWGKGAEANLFIAQQAYTKLGLTAEMVKAIEGQVGFKQTMETFLNLGHKMGEDRYVSGHSNQPGSLMTRDMAKERITSLKADTAFVAKYMAGDVASVKEMTDLHAIAHAEE
jgi:hypothetical protein